MLTVHESVFRGQRAVLIAIIGEDKFFVKKFTILLINYHAIRSTVNYYVLLSIFWEARSYESNFITMLFFLVEDNNVGSVGKTLLANYFDEFHLQCIKVSLDRNGMFMQ